MLSKQAFSIGNEGNTTALRTFDPSHMAQGQLSFGNYRR